MDQEGTTSSSESDPLLAFAAEDGLKAAAVPESHQGRPSPVLPMPGPITVRVRWPKWTSAAVAVIAIAGGLPWVYPRLIPLDAATPRAASLTIVTQPVGAGVLIDGLARGVTPFSMSLDSGSHTVTVRHEAGERVLPIILAPGADVTHHIELGAGAGAPGSLGGMSIVTDPPGAQVQLNGRGHGVSPLALTDLAAADYRVRVSGPTGFAERSVAVKPGATTSVVFSLPKVSTPAAGWLSVSAPFDVEVSEDDNVVGTGRTARIMLPAGRHSLSLANHSLQYVSERTVDVVAGQTATLLIDAPRVPISANARPWADVVIDGTSVGQTPIANLELPIGAHEVVFRHPQLGDRRQTVVVTSKGPNRIAVDLTK